MTNTKANAPALSVIVPVYQAETFLEDCARSILEQTYRDLELILVDDGSRDGSYAVMERLAAEDDRVRLLRQENRGAGAARNAGIAAAKGEYLGFVDADDVIDPAMYETMLAAAAELPAHHRPHTFIQIGRWEVDEEGAPLPDDVTPPAQTTLLLPEEMLQELFLHRGDASLCTKLTPRALLGDARFPEGVLGEDFALLTELLPRSQGVLLLAKRGYRVRHRKGSATRVQKKTEFSRAYVDILRHADAVEKSIPARYPELAPYAERFCLYNRIEYFLHVPIEDMRDDDPEYARQCAYLRSHTQARRTNPYLTEKNRRYLWLFTYLPRLTRRVHRFLRGSGGKNRAGGV